MKEPREENESCNSWMVPALPRYMQPFDEDYQSAPYSEQIRAAQLIVNAFEQHFLEYATAANIDVVHGVVYSDATYMSFDPQGDSVCVALTSQYSLRYHAALPAHQVTIYRGDEEFNGTYRYEHDYNIGAKDTGEDPVTRYDGDLVTAECRGIIPLQDELDREYGAGIQRNGLPIGEAEARIVAGIILRAYPLDAYTQD